MSKPDNEILDQVEEWLRHTTALLLGSKDFTIERKHENDIDFFIVKVNEKRLGVLLGKQRATVHAIIILMSKICGRVAKSSYFQSLIVLQWGLTFVFSFCIL